MRHYSVLPLRGSLIELNPLRFVALTVVECLARPALLAKAARSRQIAGFGLTSGPPAPI